MTLYQIYSAVDNEEAYVDLKQDDRKIVEFINYNKGNYTDEAVFIAQSGYTSKNISNTDYIQTIPKMLLFSETFINKLADKLKNELDFFPAKLRIKNDEFKFFLGKIKLTAKLVDIYLFISTLLNFQFTGGKIRFSCFIILHPLNQSCT